VTGRSTAALTTLALQIDVAVNAPEAGTIKEFLVNEEDTVTVGQDILRLELGGAPAEGAGKSEAKEPPQEQPREESKEPEKKPESESTPPPKQQESKPAQPPAASEKKESPAPSKPAKDTKDAPAPASAGDREERRVKMNRMRLRISERLKQSQNTAASLTTFNEVDMSSVMEFRKLYKDEVLKKTGVKLGFMSAFTRAACLAMKEIPAVNASIEGPNGGDTIVFRDYVDVSVAVATEKGLVTPVVRNAERMDMVGVEKAIADLGKKVCETRIRPRSVSTDF
jgi:2-oxoglutarate dehydrogenase E2 component (dihydrolipoamide succinyltransferase)